jgi:hypothetical protein
MLQTLRAGLHEPFRFDDAYMFARYAAHMRQGLGVAWNLNGVPTYGPTSLLWVMVVWALSFIHVGVWTGLVLGSWMCSLGVLVGTAWAVAANAQTKMLRSVWRVLPLVAVPLVATDTFGGNAGTGMDTMLSALLSAVFVGLVLLWGRGGVGAVWVGTVGLLSFLARPESAIAVVMLPVLVFALKPEGEPDKRGLATALGIFVFGVAVNLLVCRLYFHTALPLSFYMKGRQAYRGYAGVWHPELLMLGFLAGCQVYLAAMILFARRSEKALLICCLLPVLAEFAYLQTVTQIMGFHSRYYLPYLAYLVVPAVLVVERWWLADAARVSKLRGGMAVAVMLIFAALSFETVQGRVRQAEARSRFAYDVPVLEIPAKRPLMKLPWEVAMSEITDLLMVKLPEGATVAATEVGYLGSRALRINVIDMAGLNDTEIALRGFDVKTLLARRPDVIWMPSDDYTYMRGEMFGEPALLAQYDVYAGAANFGLAIRKDSQYRVLMDKQMQVYWRIAYPGTTMDDYRVRSAAWSGTGHRVVGE